MKLAIQPHNKNSRESFYTEDVLAMNSNLNELPQDSRVWIFQADRKLTGEEKAKIKERSSAFVATWSTHGKPLKSGVDIFYDHFLVLSVDETDWTASGCSIDQSFRFIKQLEDEMRISFLSRDRVALLNEGEVRLIGTGSTWE